MNALALRAPHILALGVGGCGIELGLKLVMPSARIVGYVEREAFAVANLAAKIEEGVLDEAPIWSDVETFDSAAYRGLVDLVSVGIPCQPFSTSGKRKGTKDKRWLWPALWRVVRGVGADYLFVEEVPPFVQDALPIVLGDLARCGWDAEWDLFSAEAMGAPEERRRMFLLARSSTALGNARHDARCAELGRKREVPPCEPGGTGEKLAESECNGLNGSGLSVPSGRSRQTISNACGTDKKMADTSSKPQRQQDNKACAESGQESWSSFGRGSSEMASPQRTRRRQVTQKASWPGASGKSERRGQQLADTECGGWRADNGGSQARKSDFGAGGEVFPPGPGLGGDGVIPEIRKLLGHNPRGAWERYQAEIATTLRWAEILADDPSVEPAYSRVAGRTSGEVDRIRLSGNGVVPLVAAVAWSVLGERLGEV